MALWRTRFQLHFSSFISSLNWDGDYLTPEEMCLLILAGSAFSAAANSHCEIDTLFSNHETLLGSYDTLFCT